MKLAEPDRGIVIEEQTLILVEGKDDKYFVEALIGSLDVSHVQVVDVGGKTKYRSRLAGLVKAPGFAQTVTSVGVVRDADDDPVAAFQSVGDALRAVGLTSPEKPLVIAGSRPRVMVMIMPGGSQPGMLEDLCLKAVADDPALPCVEEFFACVQAARLPLPHNMSKAKAQAFLASREKAGLLLGQAAAKGYWRWDSPAFGDLKAFVQDLTS